MSSQTALLSLGGEGSKEGKDGWTEEGKDGLGERKEGGGLILCLSLLLSSFIGGKGRAKGRMRNEGKEGGMEGRKKRTVE